MVAGVATAVAVLSGALLVGSSVRASLRRMATERLGRTDSVATGSIFFREALATETGGCPLIAIEGVVSNPETKRRALAVPVYGVDERFWTFHGWTAPQGAAITRALERETGTGELILRLDRPSAIPKESLHGRKGEGKSIRIAAGAVAPDFALRPSQKDPLAIFVPLRRLQRELGAPARINTILFANTDKNVLANKATLEDFGIRIRTLANGQLSIESDAAIVNRATARAGGPEGRGVFSYLANRLRTPARAVPYSLITAVDPRLMEIESDGIVLNDWAARDLGIKPGETLTADYFVWSESGNLETRSTPFRVQAITPISGLAADRQLAPEYPGISGSKTIHDWDPPFPMDLGLIRPSDEEYWNRYGTTPKAFIALATGQRLWGSRFGNLTSVRLPPGDPAQAATVLRSKLAPEDFGLAVFPVRAAAGKGAQGSTDFGEYFTYFSFFLVASAALLSALFFRLGVEQRFREIGTLRATGWSIGRVQRVLLIEGSVVALAGTAVGVGAGIGYCAFVLYGLRTWWRGAVGTSGLTLAIEPEPLASGAAGGALLALLVIWLSVRALRKTSPRELMAGAGAGSTPRLPGRWTRWVTAGFGALALGLAASGATKAIPAAASFFGAGSCLLIAALMAVSLWLRSPRNSGRLESLLALGWRNAAWRPGRSVLSIALIASAVFLIVALDAFRQSGDERGPKSGTGGFTLVAESRIPLIWNPDTPEGRENLNLEPVRERLRSVRFFGFRLRPGEDASCLNLYEPRNPRVLGATTAFVRQNRFSFAGSLAVTPEQKANPWLLLESDSTDATPAVADANSITYVLHKNIGDILEVDGRRLKLVGALSGSFLQSELIVSERNFTRLFPLEQGYRVFLIEAPDTSAGAVLEEALSDYGFDATSTAIRLAEYHRVENTYLSTFQALGALGLLLGTAGLSAVLLRNVLERRREMALLGALGYRRDQLSRVVLAENIFLVVCGLAAGAVCAAVAVAPAAFERHSGGPWSALAALLIVVPLVALLSSLLAVRVVRSAPLLDSLRSE